MWESRNAYQIFVGEVIDTVTGGGMLEINTKIYFRGITLCCKEADRSEQRPFCRTGVI